MTSQKSNSKANNNHASLKTLNTSQLIFITITSVLGAGVFNLITEVSMDGASIPILFLSFLISFFVFFFFAKILIELSLKKPEITGSLTGYAEAFLGKFVGFLSTWGYWIFVWLSNVAIIFVFADSFQNIFSFAGFEKSPAVIFVISSVILWILLIINLLGIEVIALLGTLGTILKIAVILFFIFIAFSLFNPEVFINNFTSFTASSDPNNTVNFVASSPQEIFNCIKYSLLAMLFIYIGIEDAPVLAHKAKDKKNISKAIFISLAVITFVYFLVLLAPLCFKSVYELHNLQYPAMQVLFEQMIGKVGSVIIGITIVSTTPLTLLAWNAEVSHFVSLASEKRLFFKVFSITNKRDVPYVVLIISAICSQIVLFLLFFVQKSYTMIVSSAMTMILPSFIIPVLFYLFSVIKDKNMLIDCKKKPGKSTFVKSRKIAMAIFVLVFFIFELLAIEFTIFLSVLLLYVLGAILYFVFIKK